MSERNLPRCGLIGLICLMVWAAAAIWWVTRHGPGVESNSIPFVSAASTFAKTGKMMVPDSSTGQMAPLVWWPPMYPGAMALLSKFTGDVLTAGRWLNIGLFPLNILLLALLARQLGLARLPRALICILFAFAPVAFYTHVTLLSESICLFWWLASLNILLVYQRKQTWLVLGFAALAVAMTWMSRFVAVGLIAAGGLFVLAYTVGPWSRRIARVAAFGILAAAPLEIWTHFLSGVTVIGPRKFGFYGISLHQLQHTAAAWLRWIVPFDEMVPLKLVGLAIFLAWLAVVAVVLWKRRQAFFSEGADGAALNKAGVVLILLNLAAVEGVIFFTALFLDVTLDMGERMHFFAYVFVLLLMGAIGSALVRGGGIGKSPAIRLFVTGVPGLILVVYLLAGGVWLWRADEIHLDYNSRSWRESPSIALIKQHYANSLIFTNQPGAIYLYTGRTDERLVAYGYDKTHHTALADFQDVFAKMLEETANGRGIIVYFRDDDARAPLAEIEQDPRLKKIQDLPDAVFFEPAVSPK